jgi:hypothetical protein
LDCQIVGATDLEDGSGSAEKAKVGTAGFLIELENRRAIKVGSFDSLWIALIYSYGILIYTSPTCK